MVTWWHGAPPERLANDPLGVVADRRITDAAQAADPLAALQQRAEDYAPGDTDLAWTRITPWRSLLASALDSVAGRRGDRCRVAAHGSSRRPASATAAAGRLALVALGCSVERHAGARHPGRQRGRVSLQLDEDDEAAHRPPTATAAPPCARTGLPDRTCR